MSLENLKQFEVRKEDYISEEDKAFLEKHQKIYESAVGFYEGCYELYLKAVSDQDYSGMWRYSALRLGDVKNTICKKLNEIHKSFVYQIYGYFSDRYKIQLNHREDSYEQKYNRDFELPDEQIREKFQTEQYLDIVSDILEQTGGMSFEDVSIQQLKDKIKSTCIDYQNQWRISVKGSTLKYTGYTMRETWNGNCESDDPFIKVLPKALSMFLYGTVMQLPGCNFFYTYCLDLTPTELKNGFDTELYLKKITKIKFFKNGRIDVKFDTPQHARAFAEEWCGYVPAA